MYYKSVLLIDDDIDDRDLFCITVNEISSEIDCKQFANSIEGLRYLISTTELPEIIFLDIDMYLMDGVELFKNIIANEKLNKIPLYIYSTPFMIDSLEDYVKDRVSGYLFKTSDFAQFERTLAEIIKIN